jgi:DNA-binding LacI/PurR family transcriptional regulator
MQAHGYTPCPISNRRGPKSQRMKAKSIGVWLVGAQQVPGMNWFQDQVIRMQPPTNRCPVHFSMFYSENNLDLPKPIRNREVDGVIIQGMQPAVPCQAHLDLLPTVWFMTRRSHDWAGDFVEPDNETNGRLAADYLAERGHRQLAVISTDPTYSAIAIRSEAFTQRARSRNLDPIAISADPGRRTAFINPQSSQDDVDELVQRWTELNPRPTGIYLPGDHFCGSFLRAVRRQDLEPGRDFDLILGNRSPQIYANLSYQPAAIDINLHTLVHMVIDHLIWRIDNFGLAGRVGIKVTPTLHAEPSVPSATAAKSGHELIPQSAATARPHKRIPVPTLSV